jgi:hypothetical protein
MLTKTVQNGFAVGCDDFELPTLVLVSDDTKNSIISSYSYAANIAQKDEVV